MSCQKYFEESENVLMFFCVPLVPDSPVLSVIIPGCTIFFDQFTAAVPQYFFLLAKSLRISHPWQPELCYVFTSSHTVVLTDAYNLHNCYCALKHIKDNRILTWWIKISFFRAVWFCIDIDQYCIDPAREYMNPPPPCTRVKKAKHVYSLQSLKQADKCPDLTTPHRPSQGRCGDVRASPDIQPAALQCREHGAAQKPCGHWHGLESLQDTICC